MLLFKNQQKPKKHTKNQKKKKKKNISSLKLNFNFKIFLTTKFLLRNIYQLSNDNINYLFYLKQIYLSKTAAAGCLFKKLKKKQKKVKTQKHKNSSRIVIRLLSHHQTHFSNEQNCLIALFKTFFFVNIYYSTFSQ